MTAVIDEIVFRPEALERSRWPSPGWWTLSRPFRTWKETEVPTQALCLQMPLDLSAGFLLPGLSQPCPAVLLPLNHPVAAPSLTPVVVSQQGSGQRAPQ